MYKRQDGEGAAAAIKALMEIDTIAFFSLYTSEGRELNRSAYLLCCYPLSSGGTVVATVGFIVPAFRVETMLENLIRDYDSSARLIIPGGQVFAKVDTPNREISFEGEQDVYKRQIYQNVYTASSDVRRGPSNLTH